MRGNIYYSCGSRDNKKKKFNKYVLLKQII